MAAGVVRDLLFYFIFIAHFTDYIHVNSSSDSSATHFRDLLASFDLKQWVTTPTYASGNTLDLIITRNQCGVLGDIRVVDPLTSDHCAIFMSLLLHKP